MNSPRRRLAFFFLFSILNPLSTLTSAAPVSIFDGKSLDGWEGDPQFWRVQDGVITGGSLEAKMPHNDFIATEKSYHNFDLTLKIRLTGVAGTGMINSGVQIRSVRVPNSHEMSGYQVDAGDGWWGKLYDESRRNKVLAESADMSAVNTAVRKDEWNEYRVRAEGPRIQSWINGVPALDFTETDKDIAQDGRIGFQVHSGGHVLAQFKDVVIEELPPTPDAPTWEKLGGYKPRPKPNAAPKADAARQTKGGRDISYNAIEGSAKTAEEEQKLFKLPEGFTIELVAKEAPGIGKFIAVYFDPQGRMWTMTALEYPVDANENPAAAEALYESKARDKVLIFDKPFGPGPQTPRVWADGLAIPLGLLPYQKGAYVLHGHDVLFMTDEDGDGRADKSEVMLTGFGIQDSHLFPHQFTRAPGGMLWMAQGAFNYSNVVARDGTTTKFDQTRMARFRPDGTAFEITSQGPCNIWGLVLTGEGECFIQEANDFGYPVMPFHEYANYPGCSNSQWKSYAPEFPVQAPEFKMGGTGLSGLALSDKSIWPEPWGGVMFVANPIISKIQAIRMHRDGPRWKLEKLPDFIECADPFFRPVAMTMGPDGCLYIVDWYNKIISHNEVPRAHPDRDKTRGRIWRVKPSSSPQRAVPDLTKLSDDDLIALLGTEPTALAHLAWQTLADRGNTRRNLRSRIDIDPNEPLSRRIKFKWQMERDVTEILNKLYIITANSAEPPARRIQALWVMNETAGTEKDALNLTLTAPIMMLRDDNRNIRREAARAFFAIGLIDSIIQDPDPEVRFAAIQTAGLHIPKAPNVMIAALLSGAKPALREPTAPSRSGKPILAGAAYEREFERYLIRMFLEREPALTATFLDSPEASRIPVEARLLASLALDPQESASRVAALLPLLHRAPNEEEILRLAQFPDQPGAGEALAALLARPESRNTLATQLLAQRTRLAPEKIGPALREPAKAMLAGDEDSRELAIGLIGGFQIQSLEPDLVAAASGSAPQLATLQALRQLRSGAVDLFASLAASAADPQVRDEAIRALAASRAPSAGGRLLGLMPGFDERTRRLALDSLSGVKGGAKALVKALREGKLPQDELDGVIAERLGEVLGDDPDLAALMLQLGHIFRPVLQLDGADTAWADSGITLEGPFTVETWVRLAPGIHNDDSILGAPGGIDLNFFQSRFRVYGGPAVHDVAVATKPIAPDLWTHVAVTRDAGGICKIYLNGELDAVGAKPVKDAFKNCRIGWSTPKGGTQGAFAEYRVWNVERGAAEIRAQFDRSLGNEPRPAALKFYNGGGEEWGALGKGARIAKTTDAPPLLSEEQARALDERFARYTALARKGGNVETGKMISAVCSACHQIRGAGGQIGPDLSGAGAMGLEGVLRNILTPNAAMEPGYRIFRVTLHSGDVIDAFFVSEDKQAVVVRQPGLPDRRIERKDIRATKYIRRSLMPEGLLDAFSDQQVADLLSYLMTLK